MKWVKETMLRPMVFLLTILFTGAPGAAWAVDNIPADRTVVTINTYDKFAVIKFSPAFNNNLGCGSTINATTRAAIFWNDADKKVQFASVLMAMALNLRIGFGITGCFGWGGGIPIVYRVDVAE